MFPARLFRPLLVAGALLLAASTIRAEAIDTPAVLSQPSEFVERHLPDCHPAMYLVYASRLWFEARPNDALFWYYVGQIRFRLHIAAHPRMDPATDPARFKRQLETTGDPLERYAGADFANWRGQIALALLWDKEHPNNFTSTRRYRSEWEEARTTLTNLIVYLNRHAAELRRKREADGIGETGMRTPDGPYIEVQRQRYPHDWPELLSRTTLLMLNGYYDASPETGIAPLLFADDPAAVASATSIEIAAELDDRHLRVTARHERQFLAELRLTIEEANSAIVYTRVQKDAEAGVRNGQRTTRCVLRRAETGDLVIQRNLLTTGTYPGKQFLVRIESSNWFRAPRLAPEDEPR